MGVKLCREEIRGMFHVTGDFSKKRIHKNFTKFISTRY